MEGLEKRVAVDENLKRMKMNITPRCYCCENYKKETMNHIFLTASTTQKLWKYFASFVGHYMMFQACHPSQHYMMFQVITPSHSFFIACM